LSEAEPIKFSPRRSSAGVNGSSTFTHSAIASTICFTRAELNAILDLYGRKVAAGEWRDYAIDFRAGEGGVLGLPPRQRGSPLPASRRTRGWRASRAPTASSPPTGLILKRGHDPRACAGRPREERAAGRGVSGLDA